jgi:glycerol-3-phosphate dehydrogenase
MSTSNAPQVSDEFDAIIIGGGINGVGIARDAALRGLRVLLLDKGDLGGGTTSWSSRLIHGGLRYLEHGEIGLVRESLRERERLLHNAPHLVRPIPMMIPIYRGARRGKQTIRAGMWSYDLLSLDRSLPRHQMLSAAKTLERAPGLARDGLLGSAVYHDAQVEYAERLVVENALDARDFGALILTYSPVKALLRNGRHVCGVEYVDRDSGGKKSAHAPVVLNVAGPWVDQLVRTGSAGAAPLIGGTKGSHIIVDPFPGAPDDALYVEAHADGRPFFILPWNGLYLIGTTDVKFAGDLDHLQATPAEIDYLLDETNRVLPGAGLTAESVRYTYAGVRPLPFDPGEAPGAQTRRHFVHDHGGELDGLMSVVGGKLTTYRELAEEAVDQIYLKLGRRNPGTTTATQVLPGGHAHADGHFAAEFDREHAGLSTTTRRHLLRVYGSCAPSVVARAGGDEELLSVLDPLSGALKVEIPFAFENEMARTLTDAMMRRTMIGLNRDAGLNAIEEAGRVAQKYLGWSNERVEGGVREYRTYIARFHPQVG